MKGLLAVILATAGLAAGATPANAITNGQPDGNGHPYVGVLVADYVTPGVKQRFCSGTLVAPRIVLTSGPRGGCQPAPSPPRSRASPASEWDADRRVVVLDVLSSGSDQGEEGLR